MALVEGEDVGIYRWTGTAWSRETLITHPALDTHGEGVAGQETVDEAGAIVRGEEGAGLAGGGEKAGDVEIHAAEVLAEEEVFEFALGAFVERQSVAVEESDVRRTLIER